MSWSVEYDADADETTIQWDKQGFDPEKTIIDGEITSWVNGLPNDDAAKAAIADLIQSAGTPKRIQMLWDANYPFDQS